MPPMPEWMQTADGALVFPKDKVPEFLAWIKEPASGRGNKEAV
jgi:hypothetical protein